MSKDRVRYFSDFSQDFAKTANQDYQVPEDYQWIRRDLWFRFRAALTYGVALVASNVYCRLFLHVRFRGARKLRREKSGCFLYGNHTQSVGDVFDPALAAFPKRIYTVASPANLAIPVLGRLLPYLGALPTSPTLKGMKALTSAIGQRVEEGNCVVIYPEAHVWEYCTMIRPFAPTAFKFPVKFQKPVYVMTAVYRKRRLGKKPAIRIYIDGPFYPQGETARDQARKLEETVRRVMEERSRESNAQYIRYIPAPESASGA